MEAKFALINVIGAYLVLTGGGLRLCSAVFFSVIKDSPNANSGSETQFNWIIGPVSTAHKFFVLLFGDTGSTIKDLFTWRYITVTFAISFFANIICVSLILYDAPENLPLFHLFHIRILVFSYLFFLFFNFLGDLVSVSFTRYVLSKITVLKAKYIRYLLLDVLGIFLGYFATLLPSIIVLIYCLQLGTNLNQWITTGALGSVLIPFFLFIFAASDISFIMLFFLLIAVFSITIPTATYLFFMVFSNALYVIYFNLFKSRLSHQILTFFGYADNVGLYLMILGSMLVALSVAITTGSIFKLF